MPYHASEYHILTNSDDPERLIANLRDDLWLIDALYINQDDGEVKASEVLRWAVSAGPRTNI